MKPLPLMVTVKAPALTLAVTGAMVVIAGAGFPCALIVKVAGAEVPPPGTAFSTVTAAAPAVATSEAETVAVNWVELTKVVARLAPFHCTSDPAEPPVAATKPLPVMISDTPPEPAVAVAGESVVTTGAGLLTVKPDAPEVPPPGAGFTTVTLTAPAAARSPAEMAAVSCVALTKVVVRLDPPHCT